MFEQVAGVAVFIDNSSRPSGVSVKFGLFPQFVEVLRLGYALSNPFLVYFLGDIKVVTMKWVV